MKSDAVPALLSNSTARMVCLFVKQLYIATGNSRVIVKVHRNDPMSNSACMSVDVRNHACRESLSCACLQAKNFTGTD